jgi:hypothetical protein
MHRRDAGRFSAMPATLLTSSQRPRVTAYSSEVETVVPMRSGS